MNKSATPLAKLAHNAHGRGCVFGKVFFDYFLGHDVQFQTLAAVLGVLVLLVASFVGLLPEASPKVAKGVNEFGDAAAASAALSQGTWMVLLEGGKKCSKCAALRKILTTISPDFRGKISMAVAAQGAIAHSQAKGNLLLFPGM